MEDPQLYKRPSGKRATEEDIYFAYRLLLGRDPDPAGYAVHQRYIEGGKLTLDRMVGIFRSSAEYRQKQEVGSRPTPVDFGGYKVVVHSDDPDFGNAIARNRTFDKHVCAAIREFVRKDDVVVDVGANVGVITFLAASIVGDGGRVISVEPNPYNIQLLYRGIIANGFSNVRVVPYAASNVSAVFSLSADTSNTRVIGTQSPDGPGPFVQSVILDEQLGGLPKIKCVKMDIEGHEPRAIQGFSRLIDRDRPILLVEFNPSCLKIQQQTSLGFLNQLFAVYRQIRVTSAHQDDATFESAGALLEFWEKRNREIVAQKLLPDGMLHFDLVCVP
jgi:FkbM family methyltransferase